MSNILNKYYEQPELWEKDSKIIKIEIERVKETILLIPSDVKSILDAGCGDGVFLNHLTNHYDKVIGMDISKEGLAHVKTETIVSDIDSIPFNDSTFDLITSLEVLEHLPYKTYNKALSELQRVSKKYIIISVPNNENIENSLVICPCCYCRFNPNFHMHSFNSETLKNLFTKFKLLSCKEIGPLIPKSSYNNILFSAYRTWRKTPLKETSICPQCGFQGKDKKYLKKNKSHKYNNQNFSKLRLFSKILWHRRKQYRWLLALYERKE
jgi:ubiquinone/menaquinone biosynthesis C-methylase UbiE